MLFMARVEPTPQDPSRGDARASTAPPPARLSVVHSLRVRPLAGESVSGDAVAGIAWSRGTLLALVDGLGHGPPAAEAASAFLASVREDRELPLDLMFARANAALIGTCGAVAAVARVDEETRAGEFAGIGNVEALLAPANQSRPVHFVSIAGMLGGAPRTVRPQPFRFDPDDILMMHSDGIRRDFDVGLLRAMPLQAAAEAIVRAHSRRNDDAACAIMRALAPADVAPTG